MKSTGLYMKENKKGFSAIEFIVGLAVITMLVLAAYLYMQPDTESQNTTNEETQALPTNAPVEPDSDDATINDTANEVNDLSDDINDLDATDDDLTLPKDVDFSTDY